jgi:structural maintenance of chromosome 3 (chondroitin sulfate proteoglycan 6)
MTGGFYDSRRSKLKFVKIIRDNKTAIDRKTGHLESVVNKLKDILFWFNYSILFRSHAAGSRLLHPVIISCC